MKSIKFIGSSLEVLRHFPAEVKRLIGGDLQRLQRGLNPTDFKPMRSVGAGAYELRIHLKGQWRVIYVAKFANTIYVLHSFHKKTQQTATKDIELARQRYKQIEAEQ